MVIMNPNLRLALNEEMREFIRREKILCEVSEVYSAEFGWLLRYCEKEGIPLERERVRGAISKVRAMLEEFYGSSDETLHGDDRRGLDRTKGT